LQGNEFSRKGKWKESGRFGKVQNLQGTENAREDKLESARKGKCKECKLEGNGTAREDKLESARNGICKEWNL